VRYLLLHTRQRISDIQISCDVITQEAMRTMQRDYTEQMNCHAALPALWHQASEPEAMCDDDAGILSGIY